MSGVGRLIIGTSGFPGSLHALRYGEVLARAHNAVLIPVIAWELPGGDRAGRIAPSGELGRACRDLACQRLRDALITVWPGSRDPLVQPHVERGPAGWVLGNLACRPDDVLVVGAGRRHALARLAFSRVSRYSWPAPSARSLRSRRPPWPADSGMAAWHGRSGAGP